MQLHKAQLSTIFPEWSEELRKTGYGAALMGPRESRRLETSPHSNLSGPLRPLNN